MTAFRSFKKAYLLFAMLSVAGPFPSFYAVAQTVDDLSSQQRRELTVFGIKGAFGLNIGPSSVKKVLSGAKLEKMVAAGLNGNGLLCAKITEVRALKLKSKYEVTCIAYRGGTGKKVYIVDALRGVAFEQ